MDDGGRRIAATSLTLPRGLRDAIDRSVLECDVVAAGAPSATRFAELAIAGAAGRMGRELARLVHATDGCTLAGGLEVAIACDMIVANENAKFGIPEVKRGLAAAAGGLMRLPKKIPPHIAMELALTGDFVDAKRAYELGLVNRLTSGPALDAAIELARTIADNGPLAVKKSKQVIVESGEWSEAEMWQKQTETLGNLFATNDAREGAAAFAEKRKPNWTGT
mgnify:CR=1 FL=1